MPTVETAVRKITKRMAFMRGGTRLVEPVRRYYVKRYTGAPNASTIITDFDDDLSFEVDRSSYMGSLIYWRGFHSFNELMCLKTFLKPNMTFIDVGANRGEFTAYAAKRLSEGRVLAFEPVKENLDYLKKNVALNHFSNVTVFDFGLADREGELPLFTSEDLTAHGSWHEGLGTLYKTDYRSRQVDKIKLKTLCRVYEENQFNQLHGMKIDVEGAELAVLKGGEELLKKYHPFLILEINRETFEAAGYDAMVLWKYLDGLGYKASKIGRKGFLSPIEASDIPDFCCSLWQHEGSLFNNTL